MRSATIPGMVSAFSGAASSAHVARTEPNVWWLSLAVGADAVSFTDGVMPSGVLAQRRHVPTTVAKVELDSCGAWITLANAEDARPVVVRRAGWVDARGHPFVDGELVDDRVGLGPGDALVFARPDASCATTDDAFLDALLHATPDAAQLAAAATAHSGPDAAVFVLAVPDELGADPRARVVAATGIPDDELELPGYPLGDLQPELWSEPPRPPRLARLRLRPDVSTVRDVRALLDRLVASWRLTERLDEHGLKLAASELATNAVRHASAPDTITVRYFGQGVRIDVDDNSPEQPHIPPEQQNRESGRGLRVVDAVASSWGVEARPSGKRVWCEVNLRS